MPYFFIKVTAPRPSFAFDMSDEERALVERHVAYLQGHLEKGVVVVFGPVMDPKGPYGAGVVKTDDEEEARKLVAEDPLITANCGFTFEIHPMQAVVRETALT